ncbi:phage antirepressor KilAC domain-containing protein [Bifidobacterium sp. ESL0745]|uniref:phage antirepressor KilAC domain-containing protein n=1 Tax=Bifidobacterium sp. ESL0745 TaxID=2983226 RepID=UPI0023F8E10C|nr:phage antirepressor KilAC domain-containing protein [Bifidobacterium sp. ESL0745]MDF7665695.1 BRO family protein [Bifidobacterium sp. ESL0745]
MSATSIQPFDFEGQTIRTRTTSLGETWFVLADICKALGMKSSNMVADRLEPNEKGHTIIDTLGGKQNMAIVNESGVYAIIMRSRKPEAKRFRIWVTGEVLPTIRKTGGYGKQVDVDKLLSEPENLMKLIGNYADAKQGREVAEAKVKELEPKAALADDLVTKGQTYSVGDAAKLLAGAGFQLGQTRLFQLLREWKWVFRTANGDLKPAQKHIDEGHLTTKAYASRGSHRDGSVFAFAPKILITGKGLALIYRKLSDQKFEALASTKELAA